MTEFRHTVGAHMTRSPECIGLDDSLERAAQMMQEFGIRHLPVLEGGRPVGMLAERDIALASAFASQGLDRIKVAEAMSRIPYCATPDTPIYAVAEHLASRKLDAALVMSGPRILGVFTITDALSLLAKLLEREAGPTPISASA